MISPIDASNSACVKVVLTSDFALEDIMVLSGANLKSEIESQKWLDLGNYFSSLELVEAAPSRALCIIVKPVPSRGTQSLQGGVQEWRSPIDVRVLYNGGGVFVDAAKYADEGVEILAGYMNPLDVDGGDSAVAVVYCKVGEGGHC